MADDAINDALDNWDNEWECEQEDQYPRSFTCRYCGHKYLKWVVTERGWRLANQNGRIHTCKKYDRET